jgi:hypothetical protein
VDKEYLPSFFEDKDIAAASFSVFLPGGGFFYKGCRTAGWSFYFTEMFLASYGIYNYNSRNDSLYIFAALGGIKIIDIIGAYFISPSYDFFNLEKERKLDKTTFDLGLIDLNNECIYNFMISYHF